MTDATRLPAETLGKATEENILPSNRLVLLGTYLKGDGATALVRTASGQTQMVKAGSMLGGARVKAIDDGRLALVREGTVQVLRMPQG